MMFYLQLWPLVLLGGLAGLAISEGPGLVRWLLRKLAAARSTALARPGTLSPEEVKRLHRVSEVILAHLSRDYRPTQAHLSAVGAMLEVAKAIFEKYDIPPPTSWEGDGDLRTWHRDIGIVLARVEDIDSARRAVEES